LKQVTLNIQDIFDIPTAVIYNPDSFKPVKHVTINSKEVKKGSLFIAIKGKHFDGHNFVRKAVKNGAGSVLINSHKLKMFDDINVPLITVRNTVKALGDIAKTWRKKLNATVIGLTGSAGKTTTKEMMATILAQKYNVNKTISNNNNHIGVPLTILSTNNKHEVLVAELGTNHFGEIEYTANILQPDYAMITNIGNSHIEFLKNKKGVLKEKAALFDVTIEKGGKIFINNDDALLRKLKTGYKNRISFGFTGKPQIKGTLKGYTMDGRPVISIKYKNKTVTGELPVYGKQNAESYLAAAAVALESGLTKTHLQNGTKQITSPEGRLNVKRFKNFMMIDDTYNANPESTIAAIETVNKIKIFNRKILILGDMLELGKNRIRMHRALSSHIIKNNITELYTIGAGMKYLSEAVSKRKLEKKHFASRKTLTKFLKEMNLNNSVILVKGSRGMKMEEFCKLIEARAYS